MKKIIKTLITLIVIIPILALANGYATANNQTEPHRKMTADEIPQDQTDATEKLYKLGLFRPIQQNEDGTPNFALNYYTTRFQGIKIIINFTGTVQQAKNNNHPHSFQDISISQNPYISLAMENNLIHGVSRTHFEPTRQLTADHFITMALITLEYDCGTDFQWSNPYPKSDEIRLTYHQFNEENNNISRGEIAIILLNMLTTNLNNQEITLLDKLIENNIFDQKQVNSGKFQTAIETQDKEKIKEAALAIINGTDCNYETHCCNICCDCGSLYFDRTKPHHQEPIFKTNNNSDSNNNPNSNNPNNNTTNDNNTQTNNNSNNNGEAATTSPPPQTQTPNNPPDNNNNPNNTQTPPSEPENNCNCGNCNNGCDCDKSTTADCGNCDCENNNTDICADPDCNNPDCTVHDNNQNPQEPEICTESNPCNSEDCTDCNPTTPDNCTDPNCSDPDCAEHDNNQNPQEPELCTESNPCNSEDCTDCNLATPDNCTDPNCSDPDCTEHNNNEQNPQEPELCTESNPCNNEDCTDCNPTTPDNCTDPDCTEHDDETGGNCESPFDCTDPDCDTCNPQSECDGSCNNSDCPVYIWLNTWPKSLLDVTCQGWEPISNSIAQWVKVRDTEQLQLSANHTDAIKTTSCYMFQQTVRAYEFDRVGIYHTLGFTAYNTTDLIARIQIIDHDTKYLLWSINLDPHSAIEVTNVNISKTSVIEFTAELVNAPTSITHYPNAVILADPRVDRGTMFDYTPSENPVSFLSATDIGERPVSSGNTSRWHKVINRDELPQGNNTYTEALKVSSLFMRQHTRMTYTLDREYKYLSFTAYNQSPFEVRLIINDADTDVSLLDTTIPHGTSREISVDIQESTRLELRAHFPTAPMTTPHTFNALYLCNPLLYLQENNNDTPLPDDNPELTLNFLLKQDDGTLISLTELYPNPNDVPRFRELIGSTQWHLSVQENKLGSLINLWTFGYSAASHHIGDKHILPSGNETSFHFLSLDRDRLYNITANKTVDGVPQDVVQPVISEQFNEWRWDYDTEITGKTVIDIIFTIVSQPYICSDETPHIFGEWRGWIPSVYAGQCFTTRTCTVRGCTETEEKHEPHDYQVDIIHSLFIVTFDTAAQTLLNNNPIGTHIHERCTRCNSGWGNSILIRPSTGTRNAEINNWHEWFDGENSVCRRTISCIANHGNICNTILIEETKPHNWSNGENPECTDCGATYP